MFFSKKQENKNEEALSVKEKEDEEEVLWETKEVKKAISPVITKKKEQKYMEYEVIISKNTAINGNININGCTRIDGVIDGTLAVDSDLFIGETGNIRATVYALNATIDGAVSGNIACKGRLELKSSAKVIGDIKCNTLVIAEGALFIGKCSRIEDDGEQNKPVMPVAVEAQDTI